MFFSTVLVLTIFSLTGLLIMVFYRAWELKAGKTPIPERSNKIFPVSEFLSFAVLCEERHVPHIFQFMLRHGKRVTTHASRLGAENPLTNRVTNIVEAIKGRALIVKRESNSVFLKAIAEHKEKMRNGK